MGRVKVMNEKRKKRLVRGIFLKPIILVYLLLIIASQIVTGTNAAFNNVNSIKVPLVAGMWEEDVPWTGSKLKFNEPAHDYGYDKDDDSIFAWVTNIKENMNSKTKYELYYEIKRNHVENFEQLQNAFGEAIEYIGPGNSGKYRIKVYEGDIPKLEKNDSHRLSVPLSDLPHLELLLGNDEGRFIFVGYQEEGFDGEESFESQDIKVHPDIKNRRGKVNNDVKSSNTTESIKETENIENINGSNDVENNKGENNVNEHIISARRFHFNSAINLK